MISDGGCLAYALEVLPYLSSPCVMSTVNVLKYIAEDYVQMIRWTQLCDHWNSMPFTSNCIIIVREIIDISSSSVKKHVY